MNFQDIWGENLYSQDLQNKVGSLRIHILIVFWSVTQIKITQSRWKKLYKTQTLLAVYDYSGMFKSHWKKTESSQSYHYIVCQVIITLRTAQNLNVQSLKAFLQATSTMCKNAEFLNTNLTMSKTTSTNLEYSRRSYKFTEQSLLYTRQHLLHLHKVGTVHDIGWFTKDMAMQKRQYLIATWISQVPGKVVCQMPEQS